MIAGIDEVGRGAWAGPLCVVAVALGSDHSIEGLTDSKKLSSKKREILALQIKQQAAAVGIGWASAGNIDKIGLSEALRVASTIAYSQINSTDISQIIIDGTQKFIDDPRVTTMKKADLLIPSVSAASIVAKVARDNYMRAVASALPHYLFEKHVGYGTATHQNSLEEYGPSPLHRTSVSPVKLQAERGVSSGMLAETAAVEFLKDNGYKVVDRNWKTKWCEIDIIASKKGVVHFVEVKYRKLANWGTGLESITPKKQRQMKFAAELWLTRNNPSQMVLSAISLSGEDYIVDEFIEKI